MHRGCKLFIYGHGLPNFLIASRLHHGTKLHHIANNGNIHAMTLSPIHAVR